MGKIWQLCKSLSLTEKTKDIGQSKRKKRARSQMGSRSQKQSEQDLTSDGKSWFIILVLKTW
jgi:hypothetical protein